METTKSTKGFNSKAIIGVLVFSAFLAVFNETILNVALSPLMTEMNVTAATIPMDNYRIHDSCVSYGTNYSISNSNI